ncbi:hypothetical protein DW182_03305 [Bacteroides sp. AM16-24]|uniref:hypothetical protein n=1 Tax=Bacteroides sp. AM16-24 TaxID=2292002 RepID=UPI000E5210D8|nr:hypothetical protein [Bacteroides sp. AM16-24]RHI11540.1 hypothetical protein DW182_03305 [Bacteroides sp. AM16-24]
MIYLYLLSLILLTIYIMYAVRMCGVPWSLSDTYYQLKKRNRPAWLFQMAMIIPAMLLMPVWLECSSGNLQFLAFLSCGGLMFVGSAPLFKEEFQSKVHYTGTAISGLAAILWLCLSGLWWLPLITVNAAVGIAIFKSRWMFWLEMAAFVSTYIGLLIRIIQK